MLTCLQSLHHPSGDRSQLGTSFWGEQTLNGLTGCVRALWARVKRRWLLDGNAKQPRDTQRTLSTGSKVNESGTSLLTAPLQKRFHSGVS